MSASLTITQSTTVAVTDGPVNVALTFVVTFTDNTTPVTLTATTDGSGNASVTFVPTTSAGFDVSVSGTIATGTAGPSSQPA